MKSALKIAVATFATSLIACDIVKDDVSPRDIEAIAFTYANKPAIINLSSVSDGHDLIATGQVNPQFGTFETILGGKYLLYNPSAEFKGKDESLRLALADQQTGKPFSNLNLTFKSLDEGGSPCGGLSGIYDYARIKQGETLKLDLLDNDVFCGVGYNGGIIGEVALENINTEDFLLNLGPGRIATLTYTPKPGFTGKIKLIYNLGINWLGNGPGNATSEEIIANPKKYLEAFTTAMIEVDVVAE